MNSVIEMRLTELNGIYIDDGTATIPEDEENQWLTRDQVIALCPPCGEKMSKLGLIRIKAGVLFNNRLTSAILGCSDIDSLCDEG